MTFYDDLPMMMNLVEVKIARVRLTHTTVDPVYKEVVGKEERNTVTLQAQNKTIMESYQYPSASGDETNTSGHLVFKKKYLEEMNVSLKKGDKVVSIAGDTVDYDIIEVRSESALGGNNLLIFAVYGRAKERSSV